MHYQTIMLSLLQEFPALHRTLAANRSLLPTLKQTAHTLKERHSYWTQVFRQERPTNSSEQITSEALEMAVAEMRDTLPAESLPNGLSEACSLDAAMTYLRQQTPPA